MTENSEANKRVIGKRRIRYVVRDKTGRKIKETDSRIIAWLTWFARRSEGATAHDRFSWIEDEKSWLRCGDLTPDQRRD